MKISCSHPKLSCPVCCRFTEETEKSQILRTTVLVIGIIMALSATIAIACWTRYPHLSKEWSVTFLWLGSILTILSFMHCQKKNMNSNTNPLNEPSPISNSIVSDTAESSSSSDATNTTNASGYDASAVLQYWMQTHPSSKSNRS